MGDIIELKWIIMKMQYIVKDGVKDRLNLY